MRQFLFDESPLGVYGICACHRRPHLLRLHISDDLHRRAQLWCGLPREVHRLIRRNLFPRAMGQDKAQGKGSGKYQDNKKVGAIAGILIGLETWLQLRYMIARPITLKL